MERNVKGVILQLKEGT